MMAQTATPVTPPGDDNHDDVRIKKNVSKITPILSSNIDTTKAPSEGGKVKFDNDNKSSNRFIKPDGEQKLESKPLSVVKSKGINSSKKYSLLCNESD